MTPSEAGEVMKIAVAGAVARDLETIKYEFLARHLLPLPYERTRDHVHRYVANHKWVSSLEELLEACGLPIDDARGGANARADLVRAVREGGRLVRDLRSVSGWTYVGPTEPLPPGAVEAERVAAEPAVAALGAGQPMPEEQRTENLRRFGDLARTLGARRDGGRPPSAEAARPARPPRPMADPAVVEAELRAFDARWKALERGDR